MWSDWLVVYDCGFSLSAPWCPVSMPMVLLGFLLPWTWGISSWLILQSAATAPYLGCGVAPIGRHPWPRGTFFGKVMSLLFNALSRLVTAFLPRSKYLLISPSVVNLEPRIIQLITLCIVFPSICHEVMRPDAMIFAFGMLSCKSTFSLSSFTFIKRLFSSPLLSAIRVVSSAVWGYWYFSQQYWF